MADSQNIELRKTLLSGNRWTDIRQRLENYGAPSVNKEPSNWQATALADRELISLCESDTQKLPLLQVLASLHWERFQQFHLQEDLDTAINYESEIISLIPDDDLGRSEWLDKLGAAYKSRYEKSSEVGDLKHAARHQEAAVLLTADNHSEKAERINHLSVTYQLLYERLNQLEDLKAWNKYKEQAVLLASDDYEDKPAWLGNLGNSYRHLFKRLRQVENMENSIKYLHQAVQFTPQDHPKLPGRLCSLGRSYRALFERLGNLENIKKSITYQEQAMELTPDDHPDRSVRLNNLGVSYHRLFERLGDREDLNRALKCKEQAVLLTPDDDLDKLGRLSNLGNSYQGLFDQTGQPDNLKKAISWKQRAAQLTPDDHPNKPGRLNNLGISYLSLFKHQGKVEDLDQAISCQHQAVFLTPDDHPERPARLNNLSGSYQRLFERLGRIEDLDKVISFQEEAVRLASDDHTSKPAWLSNLGTAYQSLYERLGKHDDLENSVKFQNRAIMLTPDDHVHKQTLFNSLGNSYLLLFESLGRLGDLKKSIESYKQAVELTPLWHPSRPARLSNLGSSYRRLFEHLGRVEDMQRSIKHQCEALMLTPDDHPAKSDQLSNLGRSYQCLFERRGQPQDVLDAINCFREAACLPTGNPTTQLHASQAWAGLSSALLESPIEAYRQSMIHLPKVVWLGTSVARRYESLTSEVRSLVAEAAAAAVAFQQPDVALEWLEEGRTIVWTQMLRLRTPLDQLFEAAPELAEQLKLVAHSLEQASIPQSTSMEHQIDPPLDQAALTQRRLASEWDGLLHQARDLPGFQNFLRPKPFAELANAAHVGSVVVINMHHNRCDAITLQPNSSSPVHIPLPLFSNEKAVRAREKLLSSLEGARMHPKNNRRPVYQPRSDCAEDEWLAVLSTLWTDVVQPVLHSLEYLQQSTLGHELPHITWCTTGSLAFLPLHAAGRYETPQDRVFNYVTSSYTPTLSGLLQPARKTSEFRGILAVSQAAATNSAPLPGTTVEIDHIQAIFSQTQFKRLDGDLATSDTVLNSMQEHSWVHLACHASQNSSDPNASAFQLYDSELSLARIIQKPLLHADFAFLSACQTAMGDEKLPDEVVHLAAGMLMVGYSSVIATMWSIEDRDAPEVSRDVYTYMLEGGTPDSRKAAKGLHKAVGSLRNTVGEREFARWVPFIHMGC
ncbi:hypothetical protein FRC06_009915 [Ceratobasidium sp. 370]|nr:hypothetical protein FRC06_009915 [Ceratobasidium sp. 370]